MGLPVTMVDAEFECHAADVFADADAMPMSCLLFDEEGDLVDCNGRAVAAFGCRDKRELLERFYSFSPGRLPGSIPGQEEMRERVRQACSAGEAVFAWDCVTAGGQPLPLEVTLERMRWRGGRLVLASLRDLGEAKAARNRNAALETENRLAQAAGEAKNSFLASMSHEIRTPAHAIAGLAELMRDDNLDGRQRRYLDNIRGMSRVLLRTLDDILDLSRAEAGKLLPHPVHYDIRALCGGLCPPVREALAGKGVEFSCAVADDVPETLVGDGRRLRQVVSCMLDNAVKHTDKGFVRLCVERGLWRGRDCLAVRVRDTGAGIAAEDLPGLFDRFVRFDPCASRGAGGTGLHMTLAKRLAEMMGGDISVASEPGKGSEFTVCLPLVEGDAARAARLDGAARRVMARPGARVLVVDDNSVNLDVALGHLERHGIKADAVSSGAAAVAAICKNGYDLVFMDHMMPEMDGVETTRRIRVMDGGRYRSLPIVALTANVLADAREAFLEAGMDDFVPKPVRPGDLERVLLAWLPPEKLSVSEGAGEADEAVPPPRPDAVLDDGRVVALFGGDEALYRKMLAGFRRNHDGDASAVRKRLEDGDREGARLVAHTLKGTAAVVGAGRLSAAAAAVEDALRGPGGAVPDGALDALAKELGDVLREVEKILPERQAAAIDNAKVDHAGSKALLDRLERLLAAGSAASLEMMDEAEKALAPLGKAYEAFSERMDDLDFPGALESLPALRAAVSEMVSGQSADEAPVRAGRPS